MFDIGWSEILVIVIITILVVGPKELPSLLRTVGKTIGNVRRMAGDFQNQFNDALREAELDDVKNAISDVRSLNPKTVVKDAVQKQLGFDDDMADELTEQVSQSGREINSALSDAKTVSEAKADPQPEATSETKPAAKEKAKSVAQSDAKSDVPAEAKPAAKPKARSSAKPKTQTAARTRAKQADAAPAKSARAGTTAAAKKPRKAKPATPAKAKPAAAPNEDKNASPSGDDPSQKA